MKAMVSSIKWQWQYSLGFRKKIAFCILLNIGSVCFSLLFVDLIKKTVNDAVNVGNTLICIVAIELIATKIIQLLCEQGEIYLRTMTRSELETDLEYKMFGTILDSETHIEQKIHSGDEIYRLSGDVGIVAEGIAFTFPLLIFAVVQLILTWCYLITIQPILTIIIGIIAPFVILGGFYYTQLLIPVSRRVREEGSKVNEYIQEHLQHHELIAVMRKNKFVKENAMRRQQVFLKVLKSQIRLTIGADTLTEIGFATGYLIVFLWGINGIDKHTVSYGDFLVFIQLVGQLQRPMYMFKEQYSSWASSFASIERLMDFTSLPQEKGDKDIILKGALGLRFSNVTFSYSIRGNSIFKNFSYDFKPGTVTAVIGETGVGKSTLIRMALAILTPQKGKIEMYSVEPSMTAYIISPSLRANCIYVPQGNSLLSGTIRYNLQIGNTNASEAQMKEALHWASADFVLEDFPDGLNTIVGEKGLGLSEGQAQRIAIARGLLRRGGLILLDEPTSSLDPCTEKIFLDRLIKYSKNKTVIIITHKKETHHFVSDVITISTNRTDTDILTNNKLNNDKDVY